MGGAEKIFRVAGEQCGKVMPDTADQDGGHAFADGLAAGVDRAGGGGDPVLGEMAVGRCGDPGQRIERAAALVGAPDAVGRQQGKFSVVLGHWAGVINKQLTGDG